MTRSTGGSPGPGSGRASSGAARHHPERVAKLAGHLLKAVAVPLLASLRDNAELIAQLRKAIERAAAVRGAGGVAMLAGETAPLLAKPMRQLFNDIELHLFPPSIDIGKGSNTVSVSPTVGGSTGPDGKASAGVQIDINPTGESGHYVGRLTAGVDVDDKGRPVGGSVGWRCRF